MKRTRTIRTAVLPALLVVAAAAQNLGEFRVPTYSEAGVKESEIIGRRAVVRGGGEVDIEDFRIDFYQDDGTNIEYTVTAPRCVYNQRTKIAKSPSSVRIEGETMIVTGEDFAWDGNKQLFKIFKTSKGVFKGSADTLSKRSSGSDSSKDPE